MLYLLEERYRVEDVPLRFDRRMPRVGDLLGDETANCAPSPLTVEVLGAGPIGGVGRGVGVGGRL